MVTVILHRVILAWVYRVTSSILAYAICLLVNNSWLSSIIFSIFLVTWCFFQWFALLIINLAVSVTRHYWTLLTMMSVFDRLCNTFSELWISRTTHMVLLKVVNLLILSVGRSHILLSVSDSSILMYDIAVMATSPWLDYTTLLNRSKCLIWSMDRADSSLSWDLIGGVLPSLTNSKLEQLFDVLGRDLGRCSYLNHFCLRLIVRSWRRFGYVLWAYAMLVDRCYSSCGVTWALSWSYAFWGVRTLVHVTLASWLRFGTSMSRIFARLVRCVSSEEISAFRADLEVTWTWTRQTLILNSLANVVSLDIVTSMRRVLTIIFHCLLLLVWNLLQKRKVIGFSVLFLYFWWIHILWIKLI